MHELSLGSAIVDIVLRHAEGRPVKTIAIRVGHLRQVVPSSLEFCFGFVAKGTVCEGAHLEYTIVPAWIRCRTCAQEWELGSPIFRCPSCSGTDVQVARGNEFEVESIDVEEEPCISRK